MVPGSTLQHLIRRYGPALALALGLVALRVCPWAGFAQAAPSHQIYLPLLAGPRPGALLIAAAHVDSARSGEADEAILIWNTTPAPVDLAGWQLVANWGTARFASTTPWPLPAGGWLWCTAQAAAFRTTFGAAPDCEWGVAADPSLDDPATPNLEGSALRLTNTGGVIQLLDPAGRSVDTLLYGNATGPVEGWVGQAAQLYTRGAIAAAGQLYHRKLGALDLPEDHDYAADWGGDLGDVAWGRRVQLPGWQTYPPGLRARPLHVQAPPNSSVTLAIGPEGLYAPLAQALASASVSIDLSLYTFEHPELAQIVAQAAARGVRVRVLLEGGPPGGVTDLERWCVRHMAAAGAEVRFFATVDDAPEGVQPRYRYAHAKFGVIDGRVAFVGTENFGWESMPVDTSQPAGGRRGAYLFTDAAPVVEALARLFAADWAPDRFYDLQAYTQEHAKYGDPPPDYAPPAPPAFAVDAAPFTATVSVTGAARYGVVSAPDHALRPDDGLHDLIRRAGPGDAIHLVQLYEHKYWGDADSNPVADPNPRLEMLIAAARRGATVRVLLDGLFDRPEELRANRATVEYLNTLAANEGLDLQAATGNPTGGGIHMKLVLVQVGGATWVALGSLNGGEVSHKVNREVVLLVDAPTVYNRLAAVFAWDWAHRRQ